MLADVTWGLRGGLAFGLIYIAIAGFIYAATNGQGFKTRNLNFAEVAAFYLISGMAAGAIVGVFRRHLNKPLVASLAGVAAAFPIAFGVGIMHSGNPVSWHDDTWVPTVLIAIVFGVLGARVLRD